jgi:putative ABC transport system permease protein
MSKLFYPKLAFDNIRKNRKTYLPYVITCIFTIAMFYIMASLSYNKGLNDLVGADTIAMTMDLGCWVIAIFAFIFLIYTNSFLMKQRKKEFGLFNILGMEKRHLGKVIALETLYIVAISFILGLAFGILLDKLMYLSILKILNLKVALGFYISTKAITRTLRLFAIVFSLIFLNSIRQIHLAKPIELLQSKNTGEKEPKAKWLLSLIGLICLAIGYYISIKTENPTEALFYFFLAVILVVIGTYLLFIAGSITLLKFLRKNKNYYYKTNHFISISSMIYRMKQNAAGLASICILSTMVLVMISSTTSLMVGFEDIMNERHPYDITVETSNLTKQQNRKIKHKVEACLKDSSLKTTDNLPFTYLSFAALREGDSFFTELDRASSTIPDNLGNLMIVPLNDYNRINGTHASLAKNEILVSCFRETYKEDHLKIFGRNYKVASHEDFVIKNGMIAANVAGTYYIVVNDIDELKYLEQQELKAYGDMASRITTSYNYNVKGSEQKQIALTSRLEDIIEESDTDTLSYLVEVKAEKRMGMLGVYGGLFFLGIFLGTLFTIAAILIIYYKQISEGYDDKERYEIMQKVGLSHREVKEAIQSQIITVFFLPLIMAGIHVAFAFPVISRILRLLNLMNTTLYLKCTVVCFLAFALVYGIIYSLTAKTYYQIVRR